MQCKHCGCSFRLSVISKDKNSCFDCSGVVDDLTIDDSELQVDLWRLRNPSGRTQTFIQDENDKD